MKDIILAKIEAAIRIAFADGGESFLVPEIEVTRPKDEQFGEYTTNVALVLGKRLGVNPREVAEKIKEQLTKNSQRENTMETKGSGTFFGRQKRYLTPSQEASLFEKIEVAGPGYINFYLSQGALTEVLLDAIERKEHFGDAEIGKGIRVNNEFISANPTGPLHLGNARGGFYGDAITKVLRKVGFDVTSEYYVNDAGEQVVKLGHSVLKDAEAVYAGDYIETLNARFNKQQTTNNKQQDGNRVREVGELAAEVVLNEMIKPTVAEEMGIGFDAWISEKRDVVEAGLVDRALGILKEKGMTFESEGALWLRTTDYGDDKDRVLVKSDGTRTYFASDCGYLLSKMDRGFSRFILTLGADHHGYQARLRAAATALGFTGTFDFIFVQLVRLMKDGVEVRMSKRAGNVVTIDELLEKVPVDVARFFFLLYSPDTHMNFDLGLAEQRSAKNPVYYVQYAHARLASILRKAEESAEIKGSGTFFDNQKRYLTPSKDLSLLVHPKERELLREMLFFPELVEDMAETYAVHKLPQYAIRIADKLHSFYGECRVIDEENIELTKARLALVTGVKEVFKETLRLIGVDAPERMDSIEKEK